MFRPAAALAILATAAALSPWPLEGVVASARAAAAVTPLLAGTGLNRTAYLPVIAGVARALAAFQNASGAIIDPYEHVEIQYSTPAFAMAAALVATEGVAPELLEPSMHALDSALFELGGDPRAPHCASGHSNFFTELVLGAFDLLRTRAAPARLANWTKWLNQVNATEYARRVRRQGIVCCRIVRVCCRVSG